MTIISSNFAKVVAPGLWRIFMVGFMIDRDYIPYYVIWNKHQISKRVARPETWGIENQLIAIVKGWA